MLDGLPHATGPKPHRDRTALTQGL